MKDVNTELRNKIKGDFRLNVFGRVQKLLFLFRSFITTISQYSEHDKKHHVCLHYLNFLFAFVLSPKTCIKGFVENIRFRHFVFTSVDVFYLINTNTVLPRKFKSFRF